MRPPDVSREIEAGDLGTAKRRLGSFIAGSTYDPGVCGKIGDICRDMGDPCEAGRWYFISDRPTAEVQHVISAFVSMHRGKRSIILSQFPRHAKLAALSEYPEPVRERLAEIGCETGPGDTLRAAMRDTQPVTLKDRLVTLVILLILLSLLALLVIGFVTAIGFFMSLLGWR